MAKPQQRGNQPPSHLPIVFTSHTFMRRRHIQGDPQAKEGENPLMLRCLKGERHMVEHAEAVQLIVAETGIQDKADNAEWIATIRDEAKAEAEHEARVSKQAPKHESLEEKIARIVTATLAPLLSNKKAA